MRLAVVGGTDFIGPAIVEELLAGGHEPTVVHRGLHEPPGLPDAPHAHCDRRDREALRRVLHDTGAEAIVDCCAYSRADAEALVFAVPRGARAVVLSSMDVYLAFEALLRGEARDAVPLDEESPLREGRYHFRGRPGVPLRGVDNETYEKLDVEEVVRAAGFIVLRLPVVYGPRDHLRREEPILRRVRAGRERIPIGTGNLLWSLGFVKDIAAAARLTCEARGLDGAVLNVAERRSVTVAQWAQRVLEVAGSKARLVRVPDAKLPPDLLLTGAFAQHLLVDSSRARSLLGWRDSDPLEALRTSVQWHLEHPPAGASTDFGADDDALASAG